jgi:recombinational DNA repair ATPase RecF
LTDKKRSCCTLFIGDNGDGKPSIIDTIEFVTQVRIYNTQSLSAKSKLETFNKFTNKKLCFSYKNRATAPLLGS